MSINEDYYKPIITKGTFNNNYIQYESKGDKRKNPLIKKYINIIRPYSSDIINDHKTQGKWGLPSGNKIIEHKTQSEWKVQLTMAINFISSQDSVRLVPCIQKVKCGNYDK